MRVVLFLCAALLPAAHWADEAPAVPPEVLQKTRAWMQSPDPAKRAAAFRGVHLLGPEAVPVFARAMRAARLYHEKQLSRTLSGDDNPVRAVAEAFQDLEDERKRVQGLIMTDYRKDPGEIRMLEREMEKLTKSFDRLVRRAGEDRSSIAEKVDRIAHALADLDQQLARFEDPEAGEDTRPLTERKMAALRDSFEGEIYLKNRSLWDSLQQEIEGLEDVTARNEDLAWPQGHHRQFAERLNHQRVVLGRRPLRLQENLAEAARGHCADMKRLGFFAHESPVEDKRTPVMRARQAGYEGGFAGENIATGYANALAAYQGWFGSDGHRFILFAAGPAEMGLGRAGNYWTFMSGRGK